MASCPLRLGRERRFFRRPSGERKGGSHAPERWKDYIPVGQRMPGTRFIAFKVPLKKSFEENLAPEECFSPLDLFNKVQEQNEELGLIIDLTYTNCYYKPEDLPETVPYLKIYTIGHQVSDDDTIFKFKYAVNGFLKENKDNDKLIGVHCTHGVNRTGYLICSSKWLRRTLTVYERWKDYIPVGQRMPGTRFIAFKVPLKKSFEENLAPEECFSPLDLFNKVQEQNEELGLIVDLTYTHRYYKPEDLPETVPYLKIYTIGHQVPDDDTIFKFKYAVNGFLKENKDNDKLIGVHCTHGVNRTGYLICRYLIDVEDMRPDDAIELFNRCRGHCLERQNYIEDLQNGPIRKNWESSVSRSSGFEDTTHLMEPVHTTNKSVNQEPRYNLHRTQGYRTPSRHFHIQNQGLQQSIRKFSPYQDVYRRDRIPPPGPPGGDYSQNRYSWNVKPNASQATQNKRWSSGSYYRLSYPTYCGWTE